MNSENITNPIANSDEITLRELILKLLELWKYLLTKWLMIVGFAFLGGLLGLVYAYSKKPIYTATTTFVLEDEKGGNGLGNLAGLASMAGVDLGGGGGGIFQGDNILGLYKSRMMLEKTLLTPIEATGKRELLVDKYISINKLKESWAGRQDLIDLSFKDAIPQPEDHLPVRNRLRDSVLGIIINDLRVNSLNVIKPDKKLSTIQVDVKFVDESFAKIFNDLLVKNVNDFYVQTKTKKTLQNVEILQHKTDSVRAIMNGAIYSAVAVADATPNLNPTRQVQRVAPVQRAQFSAETNKIILSEMAKNLEITKMALLKETPLIQVIDQPIFPLKKDKFGKAKGILVGGLLFGFFAIVFLFARKTVKSVMT